MEGGAIEESTIEEGSIAEGSMSFWIQYHYQSPPWLWTVLSNIEIVRNSTSLLNFLTVNCSASKIHAYTKVTTWIEGVVQWALLCHFPWWEGASSDGNNESTMALRLKDLPASITSTDEFLQHSWLSTRRHASCLLHAHDMCFLHQSTSMSRDVWSV